VTPDLPPALKAAVAREAAGVSRRDLAQRTAATTATYRAGGGSAAAIQGEADALAYALARMPATYAACASVFAEIQARAPQFAPRRLLDVGCGPGTGSWAAREAWPGLSDIAWLDASPPFLALARRLAADVFTAEVQSGDLRAADLPSADLVLASYALAEIAAAAQAPAVERLWAATAGLLVLVEPGTPAGFARLLAARDVLLGADGHLLAPCPHAAACPLTGPDWCHFSVRLPRSRDHRLAKGAEAPFEDEKFAYLVAARPQVTVEIPAARVLARPRAAKPGITLKLCTPRGLDNRFVARRDKAAHAVARRLDWGDAL
jgi:ribosomal protein RSM22 (predicted rRNA methylase)